MPPADHWAAYGVAGTILPGEQVAGCSHRTAGSSGEVMSKLRWPDRRTRVVIVLLLLGAVLVGGGLKVLLDGRRFLATAAEARRVVVAVAQVRDEDDEGLEVIRSVPVVEFVTAGERVVRYQPPVGSHPPDFQLGVPLRVLYDPANPQHVVVNPWDELWKLGVVLIGMGLALAVSGVAVQLLERSGRPA
jgi:Protein of unknown function (DUF3592)